MGPAAARSGGTPGGRCYCWECWRSALFVADYEAGRASDKERDRAETALHEAVDLRHKAEELKNEEARQRLRAEAAEADARTQLLRAEELAYVGQLAQAQSAWQAGDAKRARELLAATRRVFRGWEYAHFCASVSTKPRRARADTVVPLPVWTLAQTASGWPAASVDGTIIVWDASNGRKVFTSKGHKSLVWSVRFSPNGKRLASCGADKTIKLWDAATGKELQSLKGHEGEVNQVVFSRDGKRLASAAKDMTVKVWDAATGQHLLTLTGHSAGVESVVFSPGWRIAWPSASTDKTVKVWDAVTGRELRTLKGHTSWVLSVGFSPDAAAAWPVPATT